MVKGVEIPKDYKLTEVGVIPEDWEVKSIEELTPMGKKYCIVDGPFGSNLKTIHYRKSGIPIITSGYVTNGIFFAADYLFVDIEKFKQERRSAVSGGDIVMAKIGERCGASAILPLNHVQSILSGNALKITIDENKYVTSFIWQILWNKHQNNCFELLKTTGAQPAISMANLKKYKISVPSTRTEQTAIATALSDADALIASLEKLIAKKRAIKQGAMQELLTGKKRLPGFTGKWEVKKLGEISEIKTGKKNNDDKVENGLFPFFVRSQNVERINTYSFEGEAILIPGEGNIGKIYHYVQGKFDYHQRVYKISDFKVNHFGKFIYLFMLQFFNDHAMKNTVKATVDSLRLPTFQAFEISFPPTTEEQESISKIIFDMDSEIELLETKLNKYKALKQGMMQNLLTGKIRLV